MPVVFIYHDVAPRSRFESTGLPGPLAARYKLEPERFERHLDAIEATGRPVGLVGAGEPEPAVAFSFDDGGRSALESAAALERRGWRGHFFVVTERIGTPGFLDADAIRELDRRGHVVGSHSHTHPTYMARLSEPEIEWQWVRSLELLARALGRPPTHASVPGGLSSPGVVDAAALAGYAVLMTSEPTQAIDRIGRMRVVGRYPIVGSTSARTVAAYAMRRPAALGRVALGWKAKRLAKQVGPRAFEAARRAGT